MRQHVTTPSPYDRISVAQIGAADYATTHPEKWQEVLAQTDGDVAHAQEVIANLRIGICKPLFGPKSKPQADRHAAFLASFGETYGWDVRRFLRGYRKIMRGKRAALELWRLAAKGARHG
ncbi:hypothetical protein [Pseudoxanthomonas beigongshangi]